MSAFEVENGNILVTGLRFNDVAYTPDLNDIPERSVAALENLDLWIIDALRYTPHPSHFSVADALSWIKRMKPRRAITTPAVRNSESTSSFSHKCPFHQLENEGRCRGKKPPEGNKLQNTPATVPVLSKVPSPLLV